MGIGSYTNRMADEMKDEKEESEGIGIVGLLVIAVILLALAVSISLLTINNSQFERAKDKTLNEMYDKPIDSNLYNQGYRQGWLDAIARIEDWYYAPTNATATEMI